MDGQSQAHRDVLVAFLRGLFRTLHLPHHNGPKQKQKKREPKGSRSSSI